MVQIISAFAIIIGSCCLGLKLDLNEKIYDPLMFWGIGVLAGFVSGLLIAWGLSA